jgi:Domain of Unknown Function (DUF1080)
MRIFLPTFAVLALIAGSPAARAADTDFNGRWDLEVHKTPADKAWWLEVTGAGTPDIKGRFVGFPGGSLNDLPSPKVENGVLHFSWVDPKNHLDYTVNYVNGVLEGEMTGSQGSLKFTGHRAPVIDEHDDGTWVKGKPVVLFDGKDVSKWTGLKSPVAAGWTVEGGVLKSTGHADDLITKDKYWNFELHVEYNVAAHSNSGVGLRGRYEVQIIDDYGRPPGLHGTGTLYTRIVPPANYGKPAGEWQTLDIRLVGVEVTGTLNGNKLYEKGVIDGLTGIAFDPYEGQPGALELQGDHGAVEFRNVVLTPLTKHAGK